MTRDELITTLQDMSIQMMTVAVAMDDYDGVANECVHQHATELAGASAIPANWAEGLEAEK